MGLLDFLIDKNNKAPKPDMEYIYLLDIAFLSDKLENKPIKKGSIMTNVTQLENGSYEFIYKKTGERLCTNYAWSLAENTPENILRIEKYNNEYIKFKEYEKEINKLRNDVITLK